MRTESYDEQEAESIRFQTPNGCTPGRLQRAAGRHQEPYPYRADKGELICQPRADPTLLGYRAPHRRAAASSRMGQVGGRAAGRGHSEGFPWNGGILTAEHLEDARLLFGLDRGGSKSLTSCERKSSPQISLTACEINRWRASAARRRGNSLGAQHGLDFQAEGSCPATMVRP